MRSISSFSCSAEVLVTSALMASEDENTSKTNITVVISRISISMHLIIDTMGAIINRNLKTATE